MKRFYVIVFAFVLCLGAAVSPRLFARKSIVVNADTNIYSSQNASDYETVINEIIGAKKAELGVSNILEDNAFASNAGDSGADWLAFTLARYEYTGDYNYYLGAADYYITQKYKTENKLDKNKPTEWHRLTLAVAAAGANASAFGSTSSSAVNLAADGTYFKSKSQYDGQGISAYLWSLITIHALGLDAPSGSSITKQAIIDEILELRKADGGWAHSGNVFDTDITAMAIVALAPVMGESGETVREAVDGAIALLSSGQGADGAYKSFGVTNAASTAWVALALDSVGIDVADSRFIKNGNGIFDALQQFKVSGGGFSHEVGGKYDSRATDQVLYAYVAYWRGQQGKSKLFDIVGGDVNICAQLTAADKLLAASFATMDVKKEHFVQAARLLYLVKNAPEYDGRVEHIDVLNAALDKINAPKVDEEKLDIGLLVGILLGLAALTGALVVLYRILKRKYKTKKQNDIDNDNDNDEKDKDKDTDTDTDNDNESDSDNGGDGK